MAGWGGVYLLKKETPEQIVSLEFCKIFKNIYFVEHIQITAPEQSIPSQSKDLKRKTFWFNRADVTAN